MNPNSEEFRAFLHNMGVELEGEIPDRPSPPLPDARQDAPSITMLQQSREYHAFYQLNLVHSIPQLRVVIPAPHGLLKFRIYLVQFSEQHPLGSVFALLSRYKGSRTFERERDITEWHLLYTLGEMLKELFWSGAESGHFPSEITVEGLA